MLHVYSIGQYQKEKISPTYICLIYLLLLSQVTIRHLELVYPSISTLLSFWLLNRVFIWRLSGRKPSFQSLTFSLFQQHLSSFRPACWMDGGTSYRSALSRENDGQSRHISQSTACQWMNGWLFIFAQKAGSYFIYFLVEDVKSTFDRRTDGRISVHMQSARQAGERSASKWLTRRGCTYGIKSSRYER